MNKRIQRNPNILVGKPTIKGTRIPVYLILNLLKNGYTFDRIIKAYSQLKYSDIKAAIEFAENITKQDEEIVTVSTKRIVYA